MARGKLNDNVSRVKIEHGTQGTKPLLILVMAVRCRISAFKLNGILAKSLEPISSQILYSKTDSTFNSSFQSQWLTFLNRRLYNSNPSNRCIVDIHHVNVKYAPLSHMKKISANSHPG